MGLALFLESPLVTLAQSLLDKVRAKQEAKSDEWAQLRMRAAMNPCVRRGTAMSKTSTSKSEHMAAMVMPENQKSRGNITQDAVSLVINPAMATPRDRPLSS